ncbi:MAG TPA: PQQ-binding-like beta-propeller repeat protein [Gemmatales bacterium]|nr:PQQ-binding-like beta-propeller repeat protein [Gemmatales bacterium]HMP59882.1 PQQ-binding-like beta-propeller repeat protein [Gemmatales bacterium]
MTRILTAVCLSLILALPLAAEDWPQWLGPRRDGTATSTVAPWTGELKTLWRVPVGEGHSSPIVAEGKVFWHAKVADADEEEVVAADAKTGVRLWRQTYSRPPFKSQFGNGPRSTPLFDQGRLYTVGVTGLLTCWEAASGTRQWQIDLLKEFEAENLFFGFSTSPLIVDDKLIVMVGGAKACLVALDKKSGERRWTTGSARASYASPTLIEQGGQPLVVALSAEGLLAVRPADGHVAWTSPLRDMLNESSTTPIRVGDRLLASSVTFGSKVVRLTEKENRPAIEEGWRNARLTCYFGTPVAVGGDVYLVTGRLVPPAQADLHCVDAETGQIRWTRPKVGTYHATLLKAADRILMLEETGTLVLIEPRATEYTELARAKVCRTTWAHPALVDGLLVVRDDRELAAIALPR